MPYIRQNNGIYNVRSDVHNYSARYYNQVMANLKIRIIIIYKFEEELLFCNPLTS